MAKNTLQRWQTTDCCQRHGVGWGGGRLFSWKNSFLFSCSVLYCFQLSNCVHHIVVNLWGEKEEGEEEEKVFNFLQSTEEEGIFLREMHTHSDDEINPPTTPRPLPVPGQWDRLSSLCSPLFFSVLIREKKRVFFFFLLLLLLLFSFVCDVRHFERKNAFHTLHKEFWY